jgi:hypothetical protein
VCSKLTSRIMKCAKSPKKIDNVYHGVILYQNFLIKLSSYRIDSSRHTGYNYFLRLIDSYFSALMTETFQTRIIQLTK